MKCYHGVIQTGEKLGKKLSGEGIQLCGSPWAKKIVVLRTKIHGMSLFDYLFICVVILELLSYYMLNWALCIIRS